MAARKGPRAGCFVLLFVLLGAGWLARGTIAGWLAGIEFGAGSAPSERLADRAEDKIDRMLREGVRGSIRFSEAELQSLLTYRATPFLPAGIEQPLIDVQDSIIVLSAVIRPADLKSVSVPELIRTMLADTSRVMTALLPSVDRTGWLTVRMRSLQIGGLVVPSFMLPAIVEGLVLEGIRTEEGAFIARLPDEVAAVRIDGENVLIDPAGDPE